MKKNYEWRDSAIIKKLASGLFAAVLFIGLAGTINAQTACTIENLQGGISAGTLSIFATPGNGLAALFDPTGSGAVGDPGCGAFEPYEYAVDSITLAMADASLFGFGGEGLGTFQYRVSVHAVSMDTCTVVGDELFASPILTEEMADEGFHNVSIPVGLIATGPFFVKVTAVSWTGAADRSPSAFLWDGVERPQCRQFVYTDGGSTVTEHGNFFTPPADGWYNVSVHGNYVDACDGAIICDNFDSYIAGEFMAGQSAGLWTTWSGAPGTGEDAFVTDEFAMTAPNSVLLENATTDLVLPLGDLTTGTYRLDMSLYFPSGFGGYFNLMHSFNTDGGPYEWAIDIFFNGDGTGTTTAAGVADVAFSYPQDMWINAHAVIDLDSDIAQMWVDGVMVREWQWSLVNNTGAAGMKTLAAADFFPAAVDGARYYMDDVTFNEVGPLGCGFEAIICDKMDDYTAGALIAEQSDGLWTTWDNAPGTGTDAMVTSEISYSGDNSVILELASTDLVLPLGNLTTGSYELGMMLYFPAGNGGYFNIMHVFDDPTFEWAIDVFFNGDGTGSTTAAGEADVAFNYTEDMWIEVYCVIDLDNDLASMYVEGMNVRTWQWSLINNTGAPGVKQLAVADFFPAAVDNPKYYMDNVYFKEAAHLVCDFPTLICDNYDEYNTGALGPQADHWSTWSGTVGGDEDGIVTTDQALSAPNSMYIGDGGAQDVLLLLGNQSSGMYTLEMDFYVPAGKGGYFNIQDDEVPGVAWNLEVWFNQDNAAPGVGNFAATNPNVTFGYPEDEWFHVVMQFDLDDPTMYFYVNNELVFDDYVFPGNIGAVDYFSGDDNNNLYVDNVVFYEGVTVSVEDLGSLKDFNLYPNPNNGTFSITSAELNGSYTVDIIDISGRIVYSEQINISQNEVKEINTNNLNTGVYILRMVNRTTNDVYTTRVSIQ